MTETAPDVAALLREVVTINTRQSGEVDWQAVAQQLDDEGWRISAPEPFDDLFAASNALKRSAERKRVSAQAAPEGWTDGRSVLAAYENDVRDIEQAAVRAALEGWADRWEAEALTSTDRAVSGVLRSVAAELRHEVARLAAPAPTEASHDRP